MSVKSRFLQKRVLMPLGAVVAVLLLVPLLVPRDAVRDLAVSRMQVALGRPVSVGSVRARIFPGPGVELNDVRIGAGVEGPLVSLSIDRLSLSLAFGPLLKRQIEVTRLGLESPRAVVRIMPAVAASGSGGGVATARPAGPPLRVNVREFTVVHGALTVVRADGSRLLELGGLGEQLSATLSPGGDFSLKGETTLDTLRLYVPQGAIGEGLAVSWSKDLEWEAAARRLTVVASTLALGDLPVTVSGSVDSVGAPVPLADLEFSGGPVEVASLAGFLPTWLVPQMEGTVSSGVVSLGGHLKGALGPMPGPGLPLPFTYDLDFALKDGRLSAPGLPAPLDGIDLNIHARDDVVAIDRFRASTPSSSIEATGTMSSLLSIPVADLKISLDVDLAEAMAMQPPDPSAPVLSGRFAGALAVKGPMIPASGLAIDGDGHLKGVRVSGPNVQPAIDNIDGKIRLRGTTLELDGVVLRQGTTDVTMTGTIANYLALAPTAPVPAPAVLNLVIDGRLLDADQYAAKRGARDADSGGGAAGSGVGQAGGAAEGLARLALMTGQLDVKMQRLLTRGHELKDVSGVVRLDRGRLLFEGVRGALYGGRADLAGTVDLRDPANGAIDLDVKLAAVDAGELSRRAVAMNRFARLGGLVMGSIDGHAKLKGALDDTFGLNLATFTTNGEIEIRQARLAGLPMQKKLAAWLAAPQLESVAVTDWLQPFRIEDGKLHVDGLRLSAAGIGLRAAGWQSLDGTVALGVELTIPQDLAQGLRDRLPAAVAAVLLDGSNTPLVVPLGLAGRWENPEIQFDTGALTSAAESRVRDRLRRETDEGKQRLLDQASGELRRLAGPRADSTASAGADTVTAGSALENQVKSILKGLGKKR